jgi:hypothetical protein
MLYLLQLQHTVKMTQPKITYVPVLSERNLVYTPISHFYNTYLNIMLPLMLMLSKQSPSFRIPTLYTFLPYCMCYMSCSINFP